ncbi:uncharacterized protein TNCV_3448741 [Trichonephila clavipes]|nr:uncharacterized protein TNCV_3448741 [Trichonephila clavipes]
MGAVQCSGNDITGKCSRPSGIVVSDAHCCAVGPGFESQRRPDVCKCIVPSRLGGTLNSRRAASPLVRLVVGDERWEAPDPLRGVLSQNWGGTEKNRSVTCVALKATANDRRHLALCHDEFRGPWSGSC